MTIGKDITHYLNDYRFLEIGMCKNLNLTYFWTAIFKFFKSNIRIISWYKVERNKKVHISSKKQTLCIFNKMTLTCNQGLDHSK